MGDRLSAKFAALAHPLRRAILARLARGSATAGELAAPLTISAPALSRHLKVLVDAGLVERAVEAQRRRFSLRRLALDETEGWIVDLRATGGRGFDLVEERLRAIRRQLGRPRSER